MRCVSECLCQTQSSHEPRLPLQLFLRARTRRVAGSHTRKLRLRWLYYMIPSSHA